MAKLPIEALSHVMEGEEAKTYLEARRKVLEEYAKVVKEVEDWYKEVEAAVFEKAIAARKEHDEWLAEQLRPLDEAWAQDQAWCERKYQAMKAAAEAEYNAAFEGIKAAVKSKVPWEELREGEHVMALKKQEAIAEAEAWKEEKLADPKARFEAGQKRCTDEYARRVFPTDEWERLSLAAAKKIRESVKEIADARRDEALSTGEIAECEAKFMSRLGDALEKTLD